MIKAVKPTFGYMIRFYLTSILYVTEQTTEMFVSVLVLPPQMRQRVVITEQHCIDTPSSGHVCICCRFTSADVWD